MRGLLPINFRINILPTAQTGGLFVANALGENSDEVIGSIEAEACLKKSYAGGKLNSWYIDPSSGKPYPHMYIRDLVVDKNCRKNGIGRALIKSVVQKSVDNGFAGRVVLVAGNSRDVSPLPFYKKIGFMTTSLRRNKELDEFLKNKYLYFDNKIQEIMFLPKKFVQSILASPKSFIRR